ncbi:hypothetical protein K1719_020151 [Acacia pycnantha]|nr:hypothetical protein K1719_020151 [Acacia pycnantha]
MPSALDGYWHFCFTIVKFVYQSSPIVSSLSRAGAGLTEKKWPHLSSVSSPLARNSTNSSTNNECADVGILQSQNQWLVQRIVLQKQTLHELEVKIGDLKYRQASYDDMIIAAYELWS